MKNLKKMKNQKGQAILIVVLVLGATMLGVTTIAGYISLQKIRTATEIMDSTKAIYAADSGIEWCLFNKFGPGATSTFSCSSDNPLNFSNQASVFVSEEGDVIKSIGKAGNSYRAFGFFLQELSNP